MAMNLWAREKKWLALIPVFSGMIMDVVLIVPVYFTVDNIRSLVYRNMVDRGLAVFLKLMKKRHEQKKHQNI